MEITIFGLIFNFKQINFLFNRITYSNFLLLFQAEMKVKQDTIGYLLSKLLMEVTQINAKQTVCNFFCIFFL